MASHRTLCHPGYHPELDSKLWPGIWTPDWEQRFEELYGYNPTKAKGLLEQAGYAAGFEFNLYLVTLAGLPEIPEIGQVMAQDCEAIGLKPKLVEIDHSRQREQFRTKTIHGMLFPLAHPLRALDVVQLLNKSKDSTVYAYEHPFIEDRIAALGRVVDAGERARLLREIGDHKFNEFADIPLSLNVSHVVARQIWQGRGVSPLRGRAHRLQRRKPLRCLLVPMATTCDLLQTALN